MRKIATVLVALAVMLAPAAYVTQAQAAGKFSVTLKSSRTSVADGSKVTFTGKVSPTAAGQRVRIQFYLTNEGGSSWQDAWRVTGAVVRSDGSYSKTFTPYEGEHRWRVYKPSGAGHGAGASPAVTLKVYKWFKMALSGGDRPRVASGKEHINKYGTTEVAGTPVRHYYASDPDGSGTTRWDTDRSCARLRVDVGLGDNSAEGAAAQFRVFAGGYNKIISQKVSKGKMISIDVKFSASATPWLKFTSQNRVDVDTYLNASNPRMSCAYPNDFED